MNLKAVQHKFDHALGKGKWKWKKGETGATLTFKIISENYKYTIPFSEKATATEVLFFSELLYFFILLSLSLSKRCLSLSLCLLTCITHKCFLLPGTTGNE